MPDIHALPPAPNASLHLALNSDMLAAVTDACARQLFHANIKMRKPNRAIPTHRTNRENAERHRHIQGLRALLASAPSQIRRHIQAGLKLKIQKLRAKHGIPAAGKKQS
ncbi:hypothetical protein OH491_24760 [Termitidicoccus mucosus]|uniref:Uncharacterized protein n=1 Tax=Termitidicoccus mucosus TaxID=1184151 RepID=A0A178IP57_9BACT|nr:hypothetical protein AW736_01765 [Opitutaceae bacterium TSB47]